jgi:hypothetical protein
MPRIKQMAAAIAIFSLLLAGLSPLANAQAGVSGSGVSISPTLFQLDMGENASQTIQITLKDTSNGSIVAEPTVNDFVSDGSTGNPKILISGTSPNSIKSFVYQLNNVPLNPSQQENVSVGIHIPPGTPPGAYYGLIRYKAVPTAAGSSSPTQVDLTASVGTIVLITVPGNLHEQIKVLGLHVYYNSEDRSFFLNKPNKIGIEIENLGNGFIAPFGSIEIQNMFGKQAGPAYQFNNTAQLGNILPNSTRIFDTTTKVTGINQIGRYTVVASVAFGSGGNVEIIKKTFWYIPLWLAIVIAVVLIVLILLTIRLYIRYKRDAKHSYRRK